MTKAFFAMKILGWWDMRMGSKQIPCPILYIQFTLLSHIAHQWISLEPTSTHLTSPELTFKTGLFTFPNEKRFHSAEDSKVITICYTPIFRMYICATPTLLVW
jgi:hypothetical protein